MTNTTLVILTALISGLIATIITILWQQYNNKQERKREIWNVMNLIDSLSAGACVAQA